MAPRMARSPPSAACKYHTAAAPGVAMLGQDRGVVELAPEIAALG
ncbi:MAG: hypothetical protein WDM77_17730 [Steroidobacteraceae bacterium]